MITNTLHIQTDLTYIQATTFLLALFNIFYLCLWASRKKNWGYIVAPLSWCVHVVIFYGLRGLDSAGIIDIHALLHSDIVFSVWSAYLRLHGIFLVTTALIVLNKHDEILYRKVKKWTVSSLTYLRTLFSQ